MPEKEDDLNEEYGEIDIDLNEGIDE